MEGRRLRAAAARSETRGSQDEERQGSRGPEPCSQVYEVVAHAQTGAHLYLLSAASSRPSLNSALPSTRRRSAASSRCSNSMPVTSSESSGSSKSTSSSSYLHRDEFGGAQVQSEMQKHDGVTRGSSKSNELQLTPAG